MKTEFEEVQKFSQRWLWILLIVMTVVSVATFGYGMVEQLVFKRPWGDRPMSDMALLLTGTGVIVFVIAMLYLFYTLRLMTRVDASGIFIRFYPLRGKLIHFMEVASCEARTYRPLYEYGGWGIKYGRSGKAYNMSGDRGAQLVLKNDKRILIGSQRADELADIINRFIK